MNVTWVPRWTLWLRKALVDMMIFLWAFVQKLHLRILPNNEEHREGFDTERLGDFSSESVVFHLVFWVSSRVVLVLFWVGFVFLVGFALFGTGRHLDFCFHLFSNMWE